MAARSELYAGVEYTKLTNGTPVVAHVAHVVPGAWVDLEIVNADDKLSTAPTDLETTSSMCGRVHCIVGVNGDFHDNGVPLGGVIADGRMLRSPDPARPQLTVTKDGHLSAGAFPWTGSVSFADGTQIPLGALNTDPPPGGLTVYTPDSGAATPSSGRTELVVGARAGTVGVLGQPASLDLRGIRTGAGPIPPDGAVLSGDGAAAQQLAAAWTRSQASAMAPRARLLVSSPVAASASLGAYPVVLHNGQKATPYGTDANLIYPQQPHTLVAWNPAGDVFLVAVDGRQTASVGLSMADAADFLLGLGATDAVNLDGGGGTTFVEGGTVVNRPSDNDPTRPANYVERGATNALVVVPRPGTPPTTAPSLVTPLSVTPALPSVVRLDGPAPGGSDTPPPTAPDGGLVFGPFSGIADGANPADVAAGPSSADSPAGSSPADPTASAASAGTGAGAPTLKPAGPGSGPGHGESAMAAPGPGPDKGTGSEVHAATEALRAPLSVAEAVTGEVVDAAIGRDSHGPASKTRTAGAGLAGALAVTAVATRRRRRRCRTRPAGPVTATNVMAAEALPQRAEPEMASPVAEVPPGEGVPGSVTAYIRAVSEPVQTAAAPEAAVAEAECALVDVAAALADAERVSAAAEAAVAEAERVLFEVVAAVVEAERLSAELAAAVVEAERLAAAVGAAERVLVEVAAALAETERVSTAAEFAVIEAERVSVEVAMAVAEAERVSAEVAAAVVDAERVLVEVTATLADAERLSVEVEAAITALDLMSAEIEAALATPELESAEPESSDAEADGRRADPTPDDPLALLLGEFEADVAGLLEQFEPASSPGAAAAELVRVAPIVHVTPTGAVRFREVPNPGELRMPVKARSTRTGNPCSAGRHTAGRRLDPAR
ncbi:MAG TPA: phosphodiester glycosidase family protein [Acidimicrobiia bacterium]|nr:phosphodiester glycosidase family protein [Acidimicrobiia bacterium]